MSHYFFNRYTALSIGAQFIACALIWIVDIAILPTGNSIFDLMFYFYLPPIFLVSSGLGLKGEPGMIAGFIYGLGLGILLYGFIFGFLMTLLKGLIVRRQARGASLRVLCF